MPQFLAAKFVLRTGEPDKGLALSASSIDRLPPLGNWSDDRMRNVSRARWS